MANFHKAAALAALLAALLPRAPGQGDEPKPKLDPHRVINGSYGFLKEREPDMTDAEYALYQRIVSMVALQPDFALKLLENMMAGDKPVSPAFEFALGNLYFTNNRREPAEAHYRTAVKKYPNFLRAWTNLGLLYYDEERYPEAVAALAKAIALGDRDAGTFGVMAYCLNRVGNPVASEMAYLQALALDPENADWVEGLAMLAQEDHEYARSGHLARRLVQLKPGEVRGWLLYADSLVSQGRKLDAIAALETASRLIPMDAEEWLLMGDLCAEQGFFPEASAAYKAAMGGARNLGFKRLVAYAQMLIAQHRLDEADAVLPSVSPDLSAESRVLLLAARAELRLARNQLPDARKDLVELLKWDPLNGKALMQLGEVYRREGDRARAGFAFEQAWARPGFTYRASLELANLAVEERHYARSVDYVEKALSIEQSSELQEYLVKLKALIPDENEKAASSAP